MSVSINQLGNTITSSIDNATVAAGGVTLTATSFEQIKALSVAGSLAVGSSSESSATAFAGAGAVSENSATNGTIEASITSGSTVTSSGGAVTLDAEDQSSITAIAGEAALSDASGSSGSGAAESLGASLAFNSIDGATVESLIDASTVSAESLSLRALGNATIQATTLAADGSVAGGQGGGLAITGAGAGSSNTISGLHRPARRSPDSRPARRRLRSEHRSWRTGRLDQAVTETTVPVVRPRIARSKEACTSTRRPMLRQFTTMASTSKPARECE